jgi:predicted dehydrogenase
MSIQTNRRQFLRQTGLGAGALFLGAPAILRGQNLNSKIRVGAIGCGGKGGSDIDNVARCGAEIAALCDVDSTMIDKKMAKYPNAERFTDFREMLVKMGDKIDAVIISTPDHVHGVAAIMAMRMGKHIYCQKPLTQTMWESRQIRNLAVETKLATQMGNQGSAGPGLRRAVEVVRAGVIGNPLELHVWTNRPVWPQGIERPEGSDPVPAHLNWDLWLGPAAFRPFKEKAYHTFNWRGWSDFGTGALGDMACHTVNMPFRALDLGYPSKVECEISSRTFAETYPSTSRVRFEFPERGNMPPLKFWWYEGNPKQSIIPIRPYPETVREILAAGTEFPGSGALIIGDKGQLFSTDDYGGRFDLKLKDDAAFTAGHKHPAVMNVVPESIPRSPGHEQEWIDMIKGGAPAYSNFEIAAYLNEVILLGCIAQRIGEGNPIEWDGPNMRSPNLPAANALVTREYREGWKPQV